MYNGNVKGQLKSWKLHSKPKFFCLNIGKSRRIYPNIWVLADFHGLGSYLVKYWLIQKHLALIRGTCKSVILDELFSGVSNFTIEETLYVQTKKCTRCLNGIPIDENAHHEGDTRHFNDRPWNDAIEHSNLLIGVLTVAFYTNKLTVKVAVGIRLTSTGNGSFTTLFHLMYWEGHPYICLRPPWMWALGIYTTNIR